jgi:outer membrane receptor protein involved in Fe transport
MLVIGIVTSVISVPVPALAQSVGSVTGTVTDSTKQGLGHARVTIAGGGQSQTVETGNDGSFTVSVPPGIYTVTVQSSGFDSATNSNVVVAAGQTVTVAFSLSSASLTTIGRTTRSYTTVNTTSASTSSVSIDNFINTGRTQVNTLIDQIPGVEINRGTSNEPGGNASISIRGAQPYESQVLIDGHPVNTSGNGVNGFNSTFIQSLLLDSVEVSKGPGNLPLTIANAVGGTINFKTPTISGGPTGSLVAGYDSFNSNYYAFKFSDTFGKIGIFAGVARYQTPGYLGDVTMYGGNNADPSGVPVYPNPSYPGGYFGPGQQYDGVINFGYNASSSFESDSQLFKLQYNFSRQTSVDFSSYSTQTNLDETGNNVQYINARIVPCINNAAVYPASPACTPQTPGTTPYYYQNYTSAPYLNLIGTNQLINYYAAYPNTSESDNEPIFTGEFRTQIGPGSFLARYYAGSITRNVVQNANPGANAPCYTVACPNETDDPNAITDNGYPGEPYVEPTIDVLHGLDAQYTIPFGADYVSLGFDRHVDTASFGEDYDYTTGVPTGFTDLPIQSIAYSLRGSFQLLSDLTLETGLYESNTSYVGTRFDPRGGLVFKVNPTTTIRASAGSAFVAPYYDLVTPTSRVSGGVLELASTTFKPETSFGYDIGSDIGLGHDSLISLDVYLTNIYNRYATIQTAASGTFDGRNYGFVQTNTNQANVRNEGIEGTFAHIPRKGFGYNATVDLLRDYAYNQDPNVTVSTIFTGLPANNVQLPGYPFSKITGNVFYNFSNGGQVSFGSATYGQNNSYGEPGFTDFTTSLRIPLHYGLFMTIGATNLFNHDDYQTGGIYNGGYTFPVLGGGVGPTTLIYDTPRTVFFEITRSFGKNGSALPSPVSF